ncbi:hypothetical protein D3C73_1447560 [compost metagenome]
MSGLGPGQALLHIEAVEATRGEAVRIGVGRGVGRQPVGEVGGPVRMGAHPFGANIEAVVVQGRGIGDAETDLFAALDQDRGLPHLGQARGQHGAGESAADDDHG